MLEFEQARGQQPALILPDELTVAHMWKGAKREYAFDTVFTADATQAQVRAKTQDSKFCEPLLIEEYVLNSRIQGSRLYFEVHGVQ